MAGRHFSPLSKSRRYPIILFTLSLIALTIFFYIFSTSPTVPRVIDRTSQNPNVDYSFVSSLEKFLISSKSHPSFSSVRDDTVAGTITEQDVGKLDDLISQKQSQRLGDDYDSFYPLSSPIRVYVYNMPSKFTYDLLWLFQNTYRETSNLTSNGSPVHRLIEQHSVDYWLWADLITPESERLLKNVVRVYQQEEADLFYIPFFTTISFFLLQKQQCKALYRVKL